jgi:hypothetical protein
VEWSGGMVETTPTTWRERERPERRGGDTGGTQESRSEREMVMVGSTTRRAG